MSSYACLIGIIGLLFGLCFLQCTAIIHFRTQYHEPRIYEKAPAGTYVTTVHTYTADGPLQDVTYNLLAFPEDSAYFQLESYSGNLITKKAIDRKAGGAYQLIIVALWQGESQLLQLKIKVTVYNTFAPKFEQSVYRSELHINVTGGTSVIRVRAHDNDPIDYNAEIYYTMERNADSSYFVISEKTGDLFVRKKFKSSSTKLIFRVFAEDGGSPKRTTESRVEVTIKTISEPVDVRVANTTETSAEICWRHPLYGQVIGYQIKYRETNRLDVTPSTVNLTTNATVKCTVLENVSPWTNYQFRLYAWNTNEIGLGSEIVRFDTRPNFCKLNICRNGECNHINQQPGYTCECKEGFYGYNCDMFDPCSLKPCENYGTCKNISHNMYSCICPNHFSGATCSVFNPCGIQPSPCQNNGTCESNHSNNYHCHCPLGYYGDICQFYNPCFSNPCLNGLCRNTSSTPPFLCICHPGFTGTLCETNIDECAKYPCENGGTCTDDINSYRCACTPGYRGKRCQHIIRCPYEKMTLEKGTFEWQETPHGKTVYVNCPYGTSSSLNITGTAKRRCRLMENGIVSWGRVDATMCRAKGFKIAEDTTEKLQLLTENPNNLNAEKLAAAVEQIQDVVQYAVVDMSIAQGMFSVISNMLAINQTVLEAEDQDGKTTGKLILIIDQFVSSVDLKDKESILIEAENIAVKAAKVNDEPNANPDLLTFSPSYHSNHRKDNMVEMSPSSDAVTNYETAASITLSPEALVLAQKQTTHSLRLKFVAYKNDKFFRQRRTCSKKNSCISNEFLTDRCVLQASINNLHISNLSDPVQYWVSSPPYIPVLCVYWKEEEGVWSTEGLWINQTENVTLCFSNHLTAFSILLDPDPVMEVPEIHRKALSLISYIGCGLSLLGLFLTIITYSLFRCLNRDHSGKILLNLCISMLLMNMAFLTNLIPFFRKELCTVSAILIHYLVLTTLSWMCVEAINMYQLLIHVFASAETHFMLKRFFAAWGIPLTIVAVTAGIDLKHYQNTNEYCMLSPSNPYAYYISLLGPSCLILFINLIVFIMVSRVLFTPRMNAKPGTIRQKSNSITASQIRGAFTVMVLLGVTWVFGALAIRQLKLVFQYIFCIANSLQGLLIFIVRCVLYPEARCAWKQLLSTGTLKRQRGAASLSGSWYANSNSNQKQNGCSTSTRLHNSSIDNTGAAVFNTNYWNAEKDGSRSLPLKFPSSAKNTNQQREQKRKTSNASLYGSTYTRNPADLTPPLNDPTIDHFIDEEEQEKAIENPHPSDVYKSLLERPDYFSQELEKRNTLQRTVTTFLTGREGQRDTPTSSLLAESPHTEQSSMTDSPAPTEQIPEAKNEKKKLSFKLDRESPTKSEIKIPTIQLRMDSTEDRTEL